MALKIKLVILLSLIAVCSQAATLYVTNYGARADGTNFTASCTTNSVTVTTSVALPLTAPFPIAINGAGTNTLGTVTNADLLAWCTNISGTTLKLDRAARATTNGASATAGTMCSTGVTACLNAAVAGDVVDYPGATGKYWQFPIEYMAQDYISGGDYGQTGAVNIYTNGITFRGHGASIVGLAAWVRTASFTNIHRGFTFFIHDVDNTALATTFDSLIVDGGFVNPVTSDHGNPANHITGDGWDVTQGAIFLNGVSLRFPTNVNILNCTFQNHRGEMVKGGPDFQTANYFHVTNCSFLNGNASGWNMQYAHTLHGCTWSNLFLQFEDNMSTATVPSVFEFNTVRACATGMQLVGADTNRQPQSLYTVQSNSFQVTGAAITAATGQHINIVGNVCTNSTSFVFLGSGSPPQGNAPVSNIVIYANMATNLTDFMVIYDGRSLYVTNNVFNANSLPNAQFVTSVGGAPYGNSFFVGNRMVNALLDGSSQGFQFSALTDKVPIDDPTDDFPPTYTGLHTLSYFDGRYHSVNNVSGGSDISLDDDIPGQIPVGAQLLITNESGSTITIFTSLHSAPGWVTYPMLNHTVSSAYWNHQFQTWNTNAFVPVIVGFRAKIR